MGAPLHGKNALIYISGAEMVGANAWTINAARDTAEVPQFGDNWKQTVGGLAGWSGNITAWEQMDEKVVFDAAIAVDSVALLIYPTRNDLTSYYSGNAVFGASAEGSTGGAVAKNGDFVGDGTLTPTGFS